MCHYIFGLSARFLPLAPFPVFSLDFVFSPPSPLPRNKRREKINKRRDTETHLCGDSFFPSPSHRRRHPPTAATSHLAAGIRPVPHSPLNWRPPLPPPPFPLPSPHQERRGRSSRSGTGHDGGQICDGRSNLSLLATKAGRLDATEPISFLQIASLPGTEGLLPPAASAQPCVHEETPWTPLVKPRCSDPHQGSCTHQHYQLEMQAGRGGRSEGAVGRKGKNGMRLRREGLPMINFFAFDIIVGTSPAYSTPTPPSPSSSRTRQC